MTCEDVSSDMIGGNSWGSRSAPRYPRRRSAMRRLADLRPVETGDHLYIAAYCGAANSEIGAIMEK